MKINYKIQLLTLSALIFSAATFASNYKRSGEKLTFSRGEMTTELTVIDSEILHVKRYPNGTTPKELPNFATVLTPQKVKWSVKKLGEELLLQTPKMSVKIDKDGQLHYNNAAGKEILSESNKLTFVKDTASSVHAVSQSFISEDEALYGLGTYQSGIMDWRNASVRMLQFNQEIAVPVLISTKGYGLYWNNYGVSDFNYPEDEIELTTEVNKFLNLKGSSFTATESGIYSFMVLSETNNPGPPNRKGSCVRLSVGGEYVIDYTTMWFPDSFAGRKYLEKGKTYNILLQDTDPQSEAKLLYLKPSNNTSRFSSLTGEAIDYYYVGGENPQQVLTSYTRLSGAAPLLPKSSYGFWQCRECYTTQDSLLSAARGYRERNIPIDNIVQDWNYWPKGLWMPTWERKRYPDPEGMVGELNDMNMKLMVSVWPRIVAPDETLERYGLKEHIMPRTTFLDMFNRDVCDGFYHMLRDSMFNIGVSAIWLDGTEPIHQTYPSYQTPIGRWDEVTNIYSLALTKGLYENQRRDMPDKRVANLARSASPGQQRYSTILWSGDIKGTWKQFAEQIPAGLNFTITGIPYWTTDIGGFFRDMVPNPEYIDQYNSADFRELLTRWFQYGTFNPIYRIHGSGSRTEVWNYGKDFEDVAHKYIELRYQLMPYIYSEAWRTTTSGAVMMAPLPYQYPEDQNTWAIKDQFLFGESIMVAPVTEYKARERKLYLPEGEWYDHWSGERLTGGCEITAPAPLDQMPIYIKAGSIIPWGPKVQYATEKSTEPTLLKIYPGSDATYTLYFDDCESYGYERGEYSTLRVDYCEASGSVTLTSEHDKYISFDKNPMHFKVEILGGKSSEISYNGGKKVAL